MHGDRLRIPANRNCYRLSRVSWALLKLLVMIYMYMFILAYWFLNWSILSNVVKVTMHLVHKS